MSYPYHPPTVHMPIACWSLATLADLAALFKWSSRAEDFAWTMLALGMLFALPAIATGLLEFAKIAEDHPAKTVANWHMNVILIAFALYCASWFLRLEAAQAAFSAWLGPALSALGFLFLSVGGWLGGKLVYVHDIGARRSSSHTLE